MKSIQSNTAAAAVANLRLVDKLSDLCNRKFLNKDLCKELLKPISDSTKLLAKAYSDLSIVRKSSLSARIAKPFQSLCKKRTFGKSLFSSDLQREIKALEDETKIFKTFGRSDPVSKFWSHNQTRSKNEYRRGRGQFRPQNRGRGYRGRGRSHHQYASQPSSAKNPAAAQ